MSTRTFLPLTPRFLDGLLLLTNAVPDSTLVYAPLLRASCAFRCPMDGIP